MYKATRQLEFNPENYKGEIIDEMSETIPGQAYSINEVLIKFSQGTLGNTGMPTYYDFEEEEIEDFNKFKYDDNIYNSYDPTQSPDFDISDAEEYLRIQKSKEEQEEPKNEPKAKTDKVNLNQENETKEEES